MAFPAESLSSVLYLHCN